MSMRRLERLERAASAEEEDLDWRDYLPEGITVAEAEGVMETWARMAAKYSDDHDVSIEAALEVVIVIWAREVAASGGVAVPYDDDEDDDDDE